MNEEHINGPVKGEFQQSEGTHESGYPGIPPGTEPWNQPQQESTPDVIHCEYCHKRPAIKTDSSSRFICERCANPPGEPYRRDIRVGRNEPCPCGSGLKRKKCKHE